MADSLPPMTDETLAAIEARLNSATPGPWKDAGDTAGIEATDGNRVTRGDDFGYGCVEIDDADRDLIANAPTDLRRLIDKVRSLLVHNQALVTEIRFQANRAEEARSECAALAAKVETAAADALDTFAETLEHLPPGGEALGYRRGIENAAFLAREEADRIRPLERGSGMPHTPAQEAQERPGAREGDTSAGTGVQGPYGRTEADR